MKNKSYGVLIFVLVVVIILGLQSWFRSPLAKFFGRENVWSQLGVQKSTQEKAGAQLNQEQVGAGDLTNQGKAGEVMGSSPLTWTGHFQFETKPLDILGRATEGHVQLKYENRVSDDKRPEKITIDPSGWSNYKTQIPDQGKDYWVMNRGHLVGYQFCNQNSNAENLVTETTWFNQGGYAYDDKNKNGMTYYEQGLVAWMKGHPDDWLDYDVRALYQKNELVPREIMLSYVGVSADK